MSRLICLTLLAAAAPAWAGPAPTRVAQIFDLGGGNVRGLSISSDETVVAGANGSGRVFMVDMNTWTSAQTNDACEAAAEDGDGATSVLVQLASERTVDVTPDGYFVYIGCSDGTIETWTFYDGYLEPWIPGTLVVTEDDDDLFGSDTDTDSDGGAGWDTDNPDDEPSDTDDGSTGVVTTDGEPEVFDLGSNPIVSMFLLNDRIWALLEPSGSEINVHYQDLLDTSDAGRAQNIPLNGFQEAVLVTATGNAQIFIAHGNSEYSVVTVDAANNSSYTFNNGLGTRIDADDMTPAETTGVLLADKTRGLWRYDGSTGVTPTTPIDGGLQDVNSLVITFDDARSIKEYLVADVDGEIRVFDVPYNIGSAAVETFNLRFGGEAFRSYDMIEGPPGYVVAGAGDGKIAILTAKPFVDQVGLNPDVGIEEQEVTLTFMTDAPGDFVVRANGDREDSGAGTEVATGTADAAGEVSVTFVVGEEFSEGDNEVWVHLTDDSTGYTGAARGTFTVDNPPGAVTLTDESISFGNKRLYLTFNGVSDVDLSHYNVYVSDVPFRKADYPGGGGPTETLAGATSLVFPEQLTSPLVVVREPSVSAISVELGPLINDQTYYVAVRVEDEGGQESTMSKVVSEVPRPTFTICQRVECDEGCGGEGCSSGGGGGAAWLGLLAIAALGRRRSSMAAALVIAPLLLVSGVSEAQEGRGLSRFDRDTTPAWSNFEIRYSSFRPAQDEIRDTIGDRTNEFRVSGGPQFFRVVELDFGIGFSTRRGTSTSLSGDDSSGQVERFQMVPLSFGVTGRAHILDEQPVVPFVSVGADWIYWRNDVLTGDTESPLGEVEFSKRRVGSKGGWHWEAGGQILLDWLGPRRASILEASTGINDTWLTIAYRRQFVDPDGEGLDLSGWALQVGLQLDY